MNHSLPKELKSFVESEVTHGRYENSESVIVHALWLLKQREDAASQRLVRLKEDVASGVKDFEAGKVINGRKFIEGLTKKLKKRKHA